MLQPVYDLTTEMVDVLVSLLDLWHDPDAAWWERLGAALAYSLLVALAVMVWAAPVLFLVGHG